jgi:hypothetical protein
MLLPEKMEENAAKVIIMTYHSAGVRKFISDMLLYISKDLQQLLMYTIRSQTKVLNH